MKVRTRLLATVMVGLGLASGALADVLVSNSPFMVYSSGQQSDANSAVYSQTFMTPTNVTLDAIRWWGYHGGDSLGSIHDDFVVTLDGVVQTGTFTFDSSSKNFDEYTLDISDVALTASTLSIVNNSDDVEWYWQSTSAQGNSDAPDASAVAFSLLGRVGAQTPSSTVPEPDSLLLVLLGVAALGFGKSRRAKSKLLVSKA